MKKILTLTVVLLIAVLMLTSCSVKTVKFSRFDGVYSPFFALTEPDLSVTSMVHQTLLVTDEQDAEILDAYTKGVGIANIKMSTTENGDTYIDINLGNNIKFSDGTPLTADDVIFSMYVYADTDYEGVSEFYSCNIKGLKNYRYNNSKADTVSFTSEQLDNYLENPDDELAAFIKQKVITPVLKEEFKWVENSYNDPAYTDTQMGIYHKSHPVAKDLFAYLYSLDKAYDSQKVDDAKTVVEDIINQYGMDYKTLAQVLDIDISESARRCAEEILTKRACEDEHGTPVKSISGIEKTGEYSLKLTFEGEQFSELRKALGIFVAPLHYYGDKQLYDYEKSSFGFTRGDLTKIREKNSAPLGAGEYILKNAKELKFKANKYFYGEAKADKTVVFKSTGNSMEPADANYYKTYSNYLKN